MSDDAGIRRRPVPRGAILLAALTTMLGARSAAACAMCLSLQGAQRQAYYVTTLILIGVPVAILGIFAFWLRRASRLGRAVGAPHKDEPSPSLHRPESELQNRAPDAKI